MATVTPFQAPTVFIVDSDASLREPLAAQFRGAGWQPRFASSAEEFLAQPRALTACCLLLELQLPGITGLDLQRLVADRAEMPVIFMSRQADIPATVRAMKAGAIEFLTKPLASEPLLRAIEDGLNLSTGALRRSRQDQILEQCYQSLSLREREVMQLVVAGRLNKQVAVELGISEVTVKVHRGKLMRKMQASSLAGLVNMSLVLNQRAPAVQLAPPRTGAMPTLPQKLTRSARRSRSGSSTTSLLNETELRSSRFRRLVPAIATSNPGMVANGVTATSHPG
jgi:FixJ family two-component response regulator